MSTETAPIEMEYRQQPAEELPMHHSAEIIRRRQISDGVIRAIGVASVALGVVEIKTGTPAQKLLGAVEVIVGRRLLLR